VAYDFQVAVDCADPHALADWWAETLGWVVEEPDADFIRRMIAEGYATDADTVTRGGKLVWSDGAAIAHPDGPLPSGHRRRIIFQTVPEPKTVKNRVHLDVWVGPENVEAATKSLVGRGATVLREGRQGPHTWVTLADPGGNEFCIS
jgi:Glyoxalase-like domain